jgi:hypothetical protein
MTYFVDIVANTNCVGNTLSTFNLNASALDNNLYNLSAYAVDKFSDIYTQTTFLSTSIDTKTSFVSSGLNSASATLYSYITGVSANTPSFTRNTIYQATDGTISYDFTNNNSNVVVTVTANGFFNNISNIVDGQYGKILVKTSPTSSVSITGWGTQWTFSNNVSTMNINLSAKNIVDFYYDNSTILANLITF